MFESAELGHKIDKETYKKEVPALREALLDLQYDLAEAVNRGDGRLIEVGQELFQVGNGGQPGFFGGEHGRHPLMFKFLIPQMEKCFLSLLPRFLAQFRSCRNSKRHQQKLVGAQPMFCNVANGKNS